MPRRSRYHQIVEDEWTKVPRRDHRNMCCHCGLVHVFHYRVGKDGAIEFRATVDRRATAAVRRSKREIIEE